MRVDTSGNVGIGTSSLAGYRVSVKQSANTSLGAIGIASINSANDTYIGMGYSATSDTCRILASYDSTGAFKPISFLTSDAERMRIDTSGNLLVGQTTASQTTVGFSVTPSGVVSTAMTASTSAANSYHLYSTGAGAYRFYVGLGGTINATSTTITGISDQRLKENIRDLDDGLAKILALQPRKFDWKEGKGAGTKDARGFIAQEFEAVFPDMIEEWLDPAPEGEEPYKAVNANLIPTLVKAIQEQQALIASQSAIITALTARVEALEGTQP